MKSASLAVGILLATAGVGLSGAWATAVEPSELDRPVLRTITRDPRMSLTLGRVSVVMGHGGYQPFLFATSRGTLLCQSQVDEKPFGSKGKKVFFARLDSAISRDGGATWQPWRAHPNQDDVEFEGGAVECRDGTVLVLDTYVVPGPKPGKCLGELWKFHDDLRAFEGPIAVPVRLPRMDFDASTDDMGMPTAYARLHRSIVELAGGDLLASMYSHFAGDNAPASYLPSMSKTRVVVIRSRDHGATWAYLATVGVDGGVGTEGYGEPVLARVARGPHAGRLLCLIRTGRELYGSHSDDDGASWVRPTPVRLPGIDIYDTAKWEGLYVDRRSPDYLPSDEMIGALVDPELIQMQNGVLVCAVGARMPAKKANEGFGRSYLKGPDGKTADLRPVPGRRYDTWRAPENGDYLAFSFDGGDTWSGIVQYRSGRPTTHYAGVREIAPDLLYIVFDNSLPKERMPAEVAHRTIGFQLAVKRCDR